MNADLPVYGASSLTTTKNLPASKIGFGTGNLYGNKNRQESIKLVQTAIANGINWIDVAPLYGHGQAEHLVGEAIYRNRDRIVLVSKAGIAPTKLDVKYRAYAKAAALLQRCLPGNSMLRPPAPRRPTFQLFAPSDVRLSVERSLRALRTDRLDWLLLHEVDPHEANDPALLATLDKLVKEGKILDFGTATQPDKTCEIARSSAGARFSLLQVAAAEGPDPRGRLAVLPQSIVLHSLLGQRLQRVLDLLRVDRVLRARAESTGIDPERPMLAERLIAWGLHQPQVRCVLFSSSRIDRVESVAAASDMPLEAAQAGISLVEAALQHSPQR